MSSSEQTDGWKLFRESVHLRALADIMHAILELLRQNVPQYHGTQIATDAINGGWDIVEFIGGHIAAMSSYTRQPDVSDEVPASTFNEECLELDAAKARLQLSLRAADHAL